MQERGDVPLTPAPLLGEDASSEATNSRTSNPSKISLNDERIRLFLVVWTALLMFVVLVVFALTRDAAVLLGSTVVGIAVPFVFAYYFRRIEV